MTDNIARLLSDARVRNAKAAAKPYKLTDGGGLHLLVKPSGAKLWRAKFHLHGREGLLSLGAYPDVSLSAARDAHRTAREQVAAGTNPVHHRARQRELAEQQRLRAQVGVFARVVTEWREAVEPRLAPATVKQHAREIAKHIDPEFGRRQIETITRAEIAALVKRIELKAPEVAKNVRSYLWYIFEHAILTGLIDGNPVPPPRILKPRRKKSHKAMEPEQIGPFLRKLRDCAATPETKAAMLLALYCVTRKQEATGARWDEFDLDAGTWAIPAARMKARKPHWIPMPRQAVAMLRELGQYRRGEYLFPHRDKPNTPMADRTLNMLLFRLGYHGETVHGFRSVFSTRFNGLGANPDVIERCLAHVPMGVRAVYNRHDYAEERRAMLQDWADLLDESVAKLD